MVGGNLTNLRTPPRQQIHLDQSAPVKLVHMFRLCGHPALRELPPSGSPAQWSSGPWGPLPLGSSGPWGLPTLRDFRSLGSSGLWGPPALGVFILLWVLESNLAGNGRVGSPFFLLAKLGPKSPLDCRGSLQLNLHTQSAPPSQVLGHFVTNTKIRQTAFKYPDY